MKNKKVKLPDKFLVPRNKVEDVAGFEEIIEMIGGKIPKTQSRTSDRELKEHELYNFLTSEHQRLMMTDIFFSTKIQNIREFSQTTLLIKQEEVKNKKQKTQMINRLCVDNSPLMKNLEKIWTVFF